MSGLLKSPRIVGISWGSIEVEGGLRFKDAKLFPGGAREWDWTETGTRHVPGIQPADVQDLIDHGATTILLSQGMLDQLQVCPETLTFLEKNKIETEVLNTAIAVERYNAIRDRRPVGALLHSTC